MKNKNLMFGCAALVVLALAGAGCYTIAGNYLNLDPRQFKVDVEKDVMVEMRDGVRLATDIYRPRGVSGPLPTVLCRLPYNKNNVGAVGRLLAQRGYIFVVQDCRACYASEGDVFVPIVFEKPDGLDTVDWIVEQPWYDGNLGTWGASYLGLTQWAIMADTPHLKCTYPQITSGKMNHTIFHGGAFYYRLATGWSSDVGKQNEEEAGEKGGSASDALGMLSFIMPGKDKDALMEEGGLYNLPLQPDIDLAWEDVGRYSVEELAVKLGFAEEGTNEPDPDAVDRMIELLNYPAFAEYSNDFNFKDRYKDVNAPALMVSGWFDMFLKGQLEDFVSLREMAPGDAGKYTRIIIGPWGHVTGKHPDAGPDAKIGDMLRYMMMFDWYDRWLRGEDNGIEKEAPLRIYVMGKNEWRDENEWPLARTKYTNYYFHGGGNANSVTGDGTLSTTVPEGESPDNFTYDPMDPVITVGGNNLLESVGAKDQKTPEARDDVLVFTTPVLERDLEVTGPISATVYAASSAVDTDFTVKLCDVYPNGQSLSIADGIIRARYRESIIEPSLIEPGRIYKYEVDLWATSISFLKGHRIRIQVSSSNFPRFDRNSNAGGEGGPDNYVLADQTIYHDQDRPSHVRLPVIP